MCFVSSLGLISLLVHPALLVLMKQADHRLSSLITIAFLLNKDLVTINEHQSY